MTTYKYRIGTRQGIVEAEEYTTAIEKINKELGLVIELAEEDYMTTIVEKYINNSPTFIGLALDMEDEEKTEILSEIMKREYRIYLLDELNTENNDITRIKNYKEWEGLELDRVLETSGVDVIDFPEWIKKEFI